MKNVLKGLLGVILLGIIVIGGLQIKELKEINAVLNNRIIELNEKCESSETEYNELLEKYGELKHQDNLRKMFERD